MTTRRSVLRNQDGFALFAAFLLLVLALTLGGASLVNSTLDVKSTTHYATGNQAFFAAEAGLLHGVSRMNQVGVMNFKNDIVDRWSEVWGSSSKTIEGHPLVGYDVTVTADATDPGNRGTLTATGSAPAQARRVLRVGLLRGGYTGAPGAIYLAADSVSSQFSGNAFDVDGNNHDLAGNLAGGPALPGISTRNDTVTDGVVNSLSSGQKDNVRGLGFSMNPLTPSVLTTGGPSASDLNQIVSNLLTTPGVVTTNQDKFNGNDVFGTVASPVITRMTASNVTLNGNASGAGILIVDGSLTINGNLDFTGWIIVRGKTIINATGGTDGETVVLGNATILGSLWTSNLEIKVGGSAVVGYCDQCMRLADQTAPSTGAVPRPMTIVSWQEVL